MSPEPRASHVARDEARAARRAGWRRADLNWERLQEKGNALLASGEVAGAKRCFRSAGWIAFWCFRRSDPRQATTLANLAYADRLAGRPLRAQQRYTKARLIWSGIGAFIARMAISPRVRSSLFHMRMEAKHRDVYQENTRVRMAAFAREAEAALQALEAGEPIRCRLCGRWRAEKPAIFDDTRKLLAAALLIAAPPATDNPAEKSPELRN